MMIIFKINLANTDHHAVPFIGSAPTQYYEIWLFLEFHIVYRMCTEYVDVALDGFMSGSSKLYLSIRIEHKICGINVAIYVSVGIIDDCFFMKL